MPLDRLVLILVCVVTAAMATVYIGIALVATTQMPTGMGLAVLSLIALCAYIAWRVIAERLNNKDDDHYDKFEN